jgi:type IV secretory pathway protease TraF
MNNADQPRLPQSLRTLSQRKLLVLVVAPVAGVLLAMVAGLRINVSASLPVGAYLELRLPATIEPGMLVLVRQPGQTVRWVKPVAAVGGQSVCHLGHTLLINGQDYGVVYESWRGQPLPSAVAEGDCGVVPLGYTFIASAVPRSYDSRYYGAIPVKMLEGRVQPIVTW